MTELVSRAKDHLAHGDFGLAYTDLNIAAQVEPGNAEVQTLLQDARKKHEYVRAEQELKKGAEAEKLGDFATAAAAYKTAVNIDNSNARAAYRAALMMHKTGVDPKEIRVHAQRAADLEPLNADYQMLISAVLNDLGMKKMAKKHLDEALKINPDHPEAKKLVKKTRWPF